MKRKIIIRQINALLLLLLFIVGSAPKAYFHDLVADHRDAASCDIHHKTSVLHKQSINCHCDDLVVSAPFMPAAATSTVVPTPVQQVLFQPVPVSYHPSIVQFREGRAPPAA